MYELNTRRANNSGKEDSNEDISSQKQLFTLNHNVTSGSEDPSSAHAVNAQGNLSEKDDDVKVEQSDSILVSGNIALNIQQKSEVKDERSCSYDNFKSGNDNVLSEVFEEKKTENESESDKRKDGKMSRHECVNIEKQSDSFTNPKDSLLPDIFEEKGKENETESNKRKNKTSPSHGSLNLEKKSGKKSKHKKYQKPTDQIVKLYQCTSCPKVFQRPSSFKAHQRKHNTITPRPFSCQDCKNTFIYRCQLRDHVRTHTGERPFKCHSCSKSFARKPCLVAHMVTHSDSLPFQCDICCKRFGRKYNLVKHVQSHSGERPYGCVNCSRRFKCKQSLDKHHRIHELNIYSCNICHQSFDTKRHLTQHKINEHVSYRPFTCQICQKPFIFKSQLTYHIKEHNLERPYSCGKCKKSYFKKGHLLSHIKQYCSDYEAESQIKLEVVA